MSVQIGVCPVAMVEYSITCTNRELERRKKYVSFILAFVCVVFELFLPFCVRVCISATATGYGARGQNERETTAVRTAVVCRLSVSGEQSGGGRRRRGLCQCEEWQCAGHRVSRFCWEPLQSARLLQEQQPHSRLLSRSVLCTAKPSVQLQ